MKVATYMNNIVITVPPQAKGKDILKILSQTTSGRVIVMDQEPVGIISTRDLVNRYSKGENIYELRAEDFMTKEITTANPENNINEVLRLMLHKGIGSVLVMEGGIISGIFTERDLIKAMAKTEFSGIVDSIMTSKVITIPPHSSLMEAAKLMTKHSIRRLPIIDKHNLVGILTASDIVKSLAKGIEGVEAIKAGTKNPWFVKRLDPIYKVIRFMNEKRIGCVPVVEDNLVGIVRET
jgi:CBS domain-containing protein